RPLAAVPQVAANTPVTDAIVAMSKGGLGLLAVCDPQGRPTGIFTDGDLRRAFERRVDLLHARIGDAMSPNPHHILPERLAVEAVEMMERLRINALLVVDAQGKLAGALNMHDLFTAKVI
ncbi:MAG: CBS domain-containing protein, partial [Azonexus sp.]|nr:CBS domain-containing protein [Azonexus sp.]